MKRTTERRVQIGRRSMCRVGVALCVYCCLRVAVDSAAFVDAAAVIENEATSPSRNEATNPLKEPTPSTLRAAFLNGNNRTDVNNGSASTPPAASTTTTAAATVAETVLNVRTAAAATSPLDGANSSGSATAVKTDPAATATTAGRPSAPRDGFHTGAESRPSSSSSTRNPPTTGNTDSIYSENVMVDMLKSWFKHEDENYGYGLAATEHLRRNDDGAADEPSKAAGGNKSRLFERWDEASEEQERALEDAMRTDNRPEDDDDRGGSSSSSSVLAADQNTPSRWFVLLLSGNSTVAQMRRTDFAKYLKLNLAARLSLEYNEIKINRVLVVPPRLMVNVSVVPVSERASVAAAAVAAAAASTLRSRPSSRSSLAASNAAAPDRVPAEEDGPLHNLVETNATLMELSGEEYRVERFMSLKSQKPQSMEEAAAYVVSDRHADIDHFIYVTVGPLCFAVVVGFLLLTLYKYVRKHPARWPWKRKFGHPPFWPGGGVHHHPHHRRMTEDECCGGGVSSADETRPTAGGGGGSTVNVIYSGEFEQSQQQQLSGSWLDDASFVPDDSLDRIRAPALLQRAATVVPPPAVCKTFTDMLHAGDASCGGGGAAAAAAHAQSPRLSRDNKLRILGCKQSCLLLPAVQPAAAASSAAAAIDEMTSALPPPSLPTAATRTADHRSGQQS